MMNYQEQAMRPLTARKRAVPILVIVLLFSAALAKLAGAQVFFDPRPVLLQVIQQFQTGTPDRTWYGFEVWRTLDSLTSGTGTLLPLVELGPASDVRVNQQVPQPKGVIWQMTADHQHGVSNWLLGYSTITKRIELLGFNAGPERQTLPDLGVSGHPAGPPAILPGPSQGPNAPSNPPPDGRPGGAACKKFPNMC